MHTLNHSKSAPIFQMSEKLTWSHICELVTIDDQLEREFYERKCISEGWTVNVHVTGTEVSDILMIGVARWQKSIILLTLRLSLILSSITSVIMKQLSPSALNVVTGMSMISIPQMMVRMTRLISAVSYRNMTPKTVDIKKNRNYWWSLRAEVWGNFWFRVKGERCKMSDVRKCTFLMKWLEVSKKVSIFAKECLTFTIMKPYEENLF